MNSSKTAVLPPAIAYDNCPVTSCLKKLFASAAKSKAVPDYIICSHVAEVQKDLERLNAGGVPEMSYPYLAAMEQAIPGAAFRYVVIHKKNVPVLFAYFQLFTITSKNFKLEKNKGFVKGIFRFFLSLKKIKVLISGNALRNETACCAFNEQILSREEAAEIIASVAEKIAADENTAAVILKDIPVSAHTPKWLADMGYQAPLEDRVMTMDINAQWETLADYIAALTRKYKARANKALAATVGLSVKELQESDIVQYGKKINSLFGMVTDNQPFVLTRPAPDYFAELKKLYKNDFEVFAFFRGADMAAFYCAFVTQDAYELHYVGFDYERNSEYQLYFNILFSGLERAILLKKSQLKLGRTSFDAKASIGAKPAEMGYFVKAANIPNIAAKWFINYFSTMEDGKWKLRNPLK